MHPAPNDEPEQIPVADSSQKTPQKVVFFFRVQISENVSLKSVPRSTWVVIGWIGMNLDAF